ncbi:hypothetical protein R1flu_003218 [Riccia fluitans]|uniref:Secreted protein n=1 Tax=Riccia fluitans TaxID=41844 RepID=A0ABD1Y8I4_9MARC
METGIKGRSLCRVSILFSNCQLQAGASTVCFRWPVWGVVSGLQRSVFVSVTWYYGRVPVSWIAGIDCGSGGAIISTIVTRAMIPFSVSMS